MDRYYEPVTVPRYQWEALTRRCAQLEEENLRKSQWVSVKDRLPAEDEDVLILFKENMAVGFLSTADDSPISWYAYANDGWYTSCETSPLYWMPMPEPPEVNGI